MDKKLLDSLNNLSLALEDIADILAKKQTTSSTGAALESGDFSKDLKAISVGIKSIKADTQEILKGQKTILEMSKKNSVGKTPMEEVGGDKKQESNIKKGVGTILLIAVAVLAIGMAFKMVGKIDFLSVVGLGLAMVIVAVAFEKIAKLNLGIKQAAIVSLTMVMMAAAITLSSWILKMITPIGFTQLLTAVFIAATFAAMSKYLENIFIATAVFSKLKVSKLALVTTLVSLSTAITLSSWVLGMIRPIGITQALTGILIAAMFAVISISMHKIGVAVTMFDKLKVKPMALIKTLVAISTAIAVSSWVLGMIRPMTIGQSITGILIAAMFMIISFNLEKIAVGVVAFKKTKVSPVDLLKVLVGIAGAIALSSWVLGLTRPIGIWQFLTALGITILFAVMSYFMDKLAIGVVIVEKVLGKGKIFLIPLVLVALATAIMLSSHILSKTKDITFMLMLKILALGVILALLTTVFLPAILLLGRMKLGDLIKGSLAIVIVATAIMVSSHILALGNYKEYPDWKWALGVGLSMIAFTPAIVALGIIAMSGVGALAILAGAGMVLLVAGTIVATSHILSMGKYSKFPSLEWSGSVALSMGAFTVGMVLLGGLIIATFGIGGAMLAAGSEAVLMVAQTIVDTSFVLSKGKYTGGPTKDWSEGIALALGAFSPVYGMLMDNAILSIFGGGGVGPKEFTEAILTVSDGIITAADKFASVNAVFKKGPPKEWAEGVGLAIGAFAPVYQVLADNSGWMASGVSPTDMKNAILTISQGIVDAAYFFSENTSPFDEGKYPSKSWGEGVGAALGAFTPVFQALHEDTGWFTSGDDVVNNMTKAIKAISYALVVSARMFSGVKESAWKSYPTEEWASGVKGAINSFIGVYKKLTEGEVEPEDLSLVSQYARQMANTARILGSNKKYFDIQIDPNFVKKMSKNIVDYTGLVKSLSGFKTSSIASMLGMDPVQNVAKGMVKIASAYDKLAKAIKGFSSALNGLDPVKVNSFTRLTGNIALLSAMDSAMFSNMLKVLESRSGVFANMLKTQEGLGGRRPAVKVGGKPVQGDRRGDDNLKDKRGETQLSKLDEVIRLLSKISTEVDGLDTYLQAKNKNSGVGSNSGGDY